MELYQIRYFLSICEYGSFSRAAEACEVTQPALTAAIKKLETEIGSALFYREGKRLVLTELGSRMRPHLEQALGETQRAEALVRNFHLLRQAPLRVGSMPTIGAVRLAQLFAHFRAVEPGVELSVHENDLNRLLKQLEANELDLAIVAPPRAMGDMFRSEPLYSERYVVAFAPGHPFEALEHVTLADCSGKDYVDRLACELRDTVAGVCQQRGVELYAAFRSDREDWVQSMVMAGLGFAFMPQYSVTLQGLLTRPLVDPPVERSVIAAEVRGRQRSPVAKLFFDTLHAYAWPETLQVAQRMAAMAQG
ncbi:MAG: LysR family transcriptional regulator [Betaproteobacteria bacterium]